jgi:hypothetical protein
MPHGSRGCGKVVDCDSESLQGADEQVQSAAKRTNGRRGPKWNGSMNAPSNYEEERAMIHPRLAR